MKPSRLAAMWIVTRESGFGILSFDVERRLAIVFISASAYAAPTISRVAATAQSMVKSAAQ
jgi:hypothetical protein